jgi:hypothetical protein
VSFILRQVERIKPIELLPKSWRVLGWTAAELERRHKSDAAKLALAARLRPQTILIESNIMSKIIIYVLAAGTLCCGTCKAQSLGDIWGYAKTLKNGISRFIGTTTVTPAYAMLTWREDIFGYYCNMYLESCWRVTRSIITGDYHYYYKRLRGDNTHFISIDPFPVTRVERLNYFCDRSSQNWDGTWQLFTSNIIRDFSIAVWAAQVTKTGSSPPSQPYTVQLKSVATELQTGCNPLRKPRVQETRRAVKINDTGYVSTKMALVSYGYTWPMLCWVGGTWDY